MTTITPINALADANLFDVTIVSQRELRAVHRTEGHIYSYMVIGADGSRVLAAPTVTAGNHAHDPLAHRRAAFLRTRLAAANAQMIDKESNVVPMFSQRDRKDD